MQFALQPPAFLARLFARSGLFARAEPHRVTRWYATQVLEGATRELRCVPGRMQVHLRTGEAWITHDGDPRDVFLQARQSYAVDRPERMTLHALKGDCLVEVEEEL